MTLLNLASFIIFFITTTAPAVPTHITVRIQTKDAKFMGSSIGGALITVKDTDTGELLAKGITAGTTGNTDHLMKTPHMRGAVLSDEKSSKITLTIDIDEPLRIEVAAIGPLAQPQSANKIAATQRVIPGKHITGGDAWVLEMPGFIVDVLDPPAHIKYERIPKTVKLAANVMMMCGCPIQPGGIWDSEKFEIKAVMKKDGQAAGEFPLQYSGQTSQFNVLLPVTATGVYDITVYAYAPDNDNTGLDKTTFVVK
jgi:hypothetical protein